MLRRVLLIGFASLLASYIVWDRVEAHRLSQAINAIAARGEPIHSDDAQPTPATAEQREAASLYAQAAGIAYERALEENHRAARLDLDAPGGTEIPLEEIQADYRGDDPALQLLDRATPMDFAGFEADQRGDLTGGTSRLDSQLASLGSFACLRADLASISGDANLAVTALVPSIRLQRTLTYPPDRTMHSVRILGSLRILFRHTQPSAAALDALQRALDSWVEEDTSLRSAFLDRARYIDIATRQPFPGVAFSIAHILLHPFWLASARHALPAFDQSLADARGPWAQRWSKAEQRQRDSMQQFVKRQNAGWVARAIDPYRGMFWSAMWIRQAAYDLAARRIAALTISLERYRRGHGGSLPSSVTAPEDPFSGSPLVFKKEAESYLIYSVDENRKDDGGILYGFGAAGLAHYGTQTPRDFGIRVPLNPNRPGARP